MKFIKKPEILEAIQWTGKNLEEVKKILGDCYGGNPIADNLRVCNIIGICQIAELNDWIIKSEFGNECFAYKPDEFKKLYFPEEMYSKMEKILEKLMIRTVVGEFSKFMLNPPARMVKLAVLSEEKIKEISISEEFLKYAEETAKTGLENDEHIEYEQRVKCLCDEELKRLAAEAQLAHDVATLKGDLKQ